MFIACLCGRRRPASCGASFTCAMNTTPLVLTSILSRVTDAVCVCAETGALLDGSPAFFDLVRHQLPNLTRTREVDPATKRQFAIDDTPRTRQVLLGIVDAARLPDGSLSERSLPLDDTLLGEHWFVHVERVRFTNGDDGFLITLESEQTELKKHRYEHLITAIARCEHILLTEPVLTSAIGRTVDIIGEAAECDRCYIFQFHDGVDGERLFSQRYEWVGAGIEPEIDNPMLQNMPWEMHEPLFNKLGRGEVMHGLVREAEELFREQMTAQGILSYLFVPIIIEGMIWGWIGYDDCTVERRWLSSEITALFSLSSAIGTAIQKDALRRDLDEYNRRYKLILKTFGEVLWVYDHEQDQLMVSDEWRALLNYEGTNWPTTIGEFSEAVHPDERERLQTSLARFIAAGGDSFIEEFRFLDGTGVYRWLLSRATLDTGNDSTKRMMIGVNVDITRQKETEALLEAREEQIRKIFTLTSDVAYSLDLIDTSRSELLCSDINLFGRPAEELRTHVAHLEQYVHPEDLPLFEAALAGSAKTGTLDIQYRIVLPDGEPRWVQNRGQVHGADGTAQRLLGLILDVDDIKRAELTVRAINQQLEDRVRERTEELRRTNALLYEREQRSRIRSELVSDYTYEFRLTDDGAMLLWNLSDTFAALTGHDISALVNQRYEDLLGRIYHPDDAAVITRHRERLQAGQASSSEYRILRKDGTTLWVEGHARPIWNDTHTRIERVIGLSRDIDEKKRIQLSLEESERKNRAIVEALPDMIFITNADGVYLDFHAQSRSELLRPDGSFIGMSMREVLPAHVADDYADVLMSVVQTGELQIYEYMLDLPHGNRYFEARVRPYGSETYLTIVRDITDRKVDEDRILELNRTLEQRVDERTRALRSSQERYRLITEHSHDLIKIIDANDRCTYVSPSVTRILGYAQEEINGMSLRTLLPDDTNDTRDSFDAMLAQMGSGRPLVMQMRHKNGSLRSLEMIASRMINEDGSEAGILIVSRDVTDRERMTRELELALVREQELNELQRRFVSTASHQFRTPLTVIQSGMELIEMVVETAPEQLQTRLFRQTERVKSEVVRMTDLMNDILILGRHSARKTAFAPEEVQVRDFMTDIIARNFSDRKDGRHVQFDDGCSAGSCWMDPKLIAHVLVNIISNAFKYATTGNPRVWCATTASHLLIHVEDKGIGVPDEDVPNLFQPFYRGVNATQFQGTGLGLTIAKEFVDLHGGTIEIARGERRGTRFTVILPTHRIDHDTHPGH